MFRQRIFLHLVVAILFHKIAEYDADVISFQTAPNEVEYASCGFDKNLTWIYDNVRLFEKITWYVQQGSTAKKQIAYISNSTSLFKVNHAAIYPPANDDRLEYIANAGLRIKNFKDGDEADISVEIDYADFHHSSGKTKVVIYDSPRNIPPYLNNETRAVLNDASKNFLCNVTSTAVTITWFKDGTKLIHDGAKYNISFRTYNMDRIPGCSNVVVESTLSILNVAQTDAGNISCSAATAINTVIFSNQTSQLIVEYAPGDVTVTEITVMPSNTNVGKIAVISCLAYSVPNPSYEIWKNEFLLLSGTSAKGIAFNYTTSALNFYDEGNYSCKAINSHGIDIVNAALYVTAKPQIWYIQGPTVEVSIGDHVNITCGIYGDPLQTSNLNWTKIEGVSSAFTENSTMHFSNSSITYINHTLVIMQATQSHYGVYRCYGWNNLGVVYENVSVFIISPVTITASNLVHPSEELVENQVKVFTCTANSYPKPVITWKNDGVPIMSVVPTVTESYNGMWNVTSSISVDLTNTFSGIIECVASNDITSDSNVTNIVLKYKPVPILTAVNKRNFVFDGERLFTAAVNDVVHLLCTVHGYPKPSITWFKDNTDVASLFDNLNITETNNVNSWTVTSWIQLTVVNKDVNNDMYKCETKNDVGIVSSSLKVRILNGNFTVSPTNLLCVAVGSDAKFDWQYEYSQPIDFIKWETHTNQNQTIKQTLGRLDNNEGSGYSGSMKDARYVYDTTTLSGLTVKTITKEDEDWYGIKINFKNSPDVLIDAVYLLVVINPHDTKITPVEAAVVENENVSLVCTTTSKPAASIEWYKDYSSRLSNGVDYVITETSVNVVANETIIQSTLVIINSQMSDIANYTCNAVGKLGSENAHKELTVQHAPKDTTLVASHNPLFAGNSTYITCKVTTAVPNTIYYQIHLNSSLVHNSTNGTMLINPVANYHGGLYRCTPLNIVGPGDVASLLLNVSISPVLISHNDPVVVRESSNAVLTCKFYGNPAPVIYWRKLAGGNQDDINVTATTTASNSTLSIIEQSVTSVSVSRPDAGIYNCFANNSYGSVSQNINLVVHYPVNITSHTLVQPSENLTEGESLSRECIATGFPKPVTLTWKLNSKPISRHSVSQPIVVGEGSNYVTVKSTITISYVDKDDMGLFECFASNSAGNDTEATNVYVKYPPTLSGKPDPTEYFNVGASLTLACVSTSNELAFIHWYKDGVELFHNDGTHEIVETPNEPISQITSTLKATPVQLTTAGEYTCNASNSLGFEAFATNVEVNYQATIKSYPSAIISAREFETDYTIRCIATGNPTPIITWHKNGVEMTNFPLANYERADTTNDTAIDSTLKILTIGLADYGNWTCKAKNTIAGNLVASDKKTTLMTISYDPTFLPTYPNSQYLVNETKTITLSCRVKSYPTPYVWWVVPTGVTADARFNFQTNTVFQNTEYSIVEQNLTITNAEKADYGLYMCHANNTIASIQKKSELVVQYKATPDTSQKIQITEGVNSLFLQVIAISNPASNFTYQFNGSIISSNHVTNEYVNSTSSSETVQTSILSKANVDSKNGGVYKIHSCNIVGCKLDEWTVIINYKPILQVSMPSIEHVNNTNDYTLTCKYTGNPIPTITWKRSGNMLITEGNIAISNVVVHTGQFDSEVASTITLSSINYDQGGMYTCSASNVVGTSDTFTNVTVCYAPVIEKDLVNQIVHVTTGTPLVLEMQVHSYPNAMFIWRKDNVEPLTNPMPTINVNPHNADYFTYNQSAMISTTAAREMSGIYNVTSCNFLGCANSQTTTVIIKYPPIHTVINDIVVVENQSASFICNVHSEPVAIITWWLNGTMQVTNDGDVTIINTLTNNSWSRTVSSVLTMVNVTRVSDAGIYTCRATNGIGTTNESANLTVKYPPIEVTGLKNTTVNEGQPFNLVYDVRSFSESTFTWDHNGTVVNSDYIQTSENLYRGVFDVYKRGILHLDGSKMTKEKAGIYTVTVTNGIGSDINSSACVVVNYAPILESNFDNETIVHKNTSPSLTCDIDSYPVSTVEWYKNGVIMSTPSSGYTINMVTLEATKFGAKIRSNLTFTSVDKTKSDHYSCKASNVLGSVEDKTHMIVYYAPVIVPNFPPSFNATEHVFTSLTCNVDANPAATTNWFYSTDKGLNYDLFNGSTSQLVKGVEFKLHETKYVTTLLFSPNNIKVADEGWYYCKATNLLGSTQRDTKINVQYAPKFVAPGLMSGHENATIGSTRTFTCRFQSNPGWQSIQWLKNGVVISSSSYAIREVSNIDQTVTIESVMTFTNIASSDRASYECKATNAIGSSSQSQELNVLYRPQLTAVNRNITLDRNETLLLQCTSNANPPATHIWRKNGVTLTNNQVNYITTTIGSEGKYECTPTNEVGSGNTVTYYVHVRLPPTVSTHATCTQTPQASNGTNTLCSCQGSGYPAPIIYWTKYPSTVILSNSSSLSIPVSLVNDGSYICHVSNEVGEITSVAQLAVFGPLTGSWTVWGGCNNSCGAGSHFRTRQCKNVACIELLVEWKSCVGSCQSKPIPLVNGEADDWYIALYVLVPLSFVLLVLAAFWLARLNRKPDDGPVIVPINPNIARPPGMPQHIIPAGVVNNGYIPEPETESIEVNLLFDDDIVESETDVLDLPDEELSIPGSPTPSVPSIPESLPGTPSFTSDMGNFYEELPMEYDFRAL